MSQKKALLVTTVSGFVPQFEMNNVRLLQSMGYEVHYAANYHTPSYGKDNSRLDGSGIVRHQIDFVRSPFKPANLRVYRQLCRLMCSEHFDLVHCHTPMGSVMARLAAHRTHTQPVIYTAHGFHFFKGAPFINWLFYYPVERFLSRYTDQLICINKEDYLRAKKEFHAAHVDYIPGVGMDFSKIKQLDAAAVSKKRRELALTDDTLLFLSSGELIKRKNHETAIRAVAQIKQLALAEHKELPAFRYVICGHGELNQRLQMLIQELEVDDLVTLLGYRNDILELYQAADVFLFPSYQEGLPMAMLEAMACGLPVICSDIRGNRDLVEACTDSFMHGKPTNTNLKAQNHECEAACNVCASSTHYPGGMMIQGADNVDAFAQAIHHMLHNRQALPQMGAANRIASGQFDMAVVSEKMEAIYHRINDR